MARLKEIDKLCTCSKEGWRKQRPRFNKELFLLDILREADKTVLRRKEEARRKALPFCQRAIESAWKYITMAFAQYVLCFLCLT
jgi:hypothetical protein